MKLICAVELLGNRPGERIGFVTFYESGYSSGTLDRKEYTKEQVQLAIHEFNAERGIPDDVAKSALYGSMFGWHVPAAQKAIDFFAAYAVSN
jgi:hypothetical protein